MAGRLDYRMIGALVWAISEAPDAEITAGNLTTGPLGPAPQVDPVFFGVINQVIEDANGKSELQAARAFFRRVRQAACLCGRPIVRSRQVR
jgi:hypothetical protein